MVSTNGPRIGDHASEKQADSQHEIDDLQNTPDVATSEVDELDERDAHESSINKTSTAVAEVKTKPQPLRKKRLSAIDRTVMEFQPDVVELEHRKVAGGARWTLYTAILLIVAAISWAYWAKVDRIVICTGELISSEDPILIYATDQLKVVQLHAKFNERVKAGDLLVTLDPTFSQADVDRLRMQSVGLEIRIARLRAELALLDDDDDPSFELNLERYSRDRAFVEQSLLDEQLTFNERTREYRSEIRRMEAERKKIESTQRSNENSILARTDIIETLRKRTETERVLVDRAVSALTTLQDLEMRLVSSEFELTAETNRRDELVEDINVNLRQLDQYKARWRSEISQLLIQTQAEYNEASNQLIKAEHARQLAEIRVPLNSEYGDDAEFIVLDRSDLTTGSTASPNQPIYRLMPASTKLELEIQIDGKDVARLRADRVANPETDQEKGDTVRVKLASLPFQKHGTLEGRLRAISEGTFSEGQGPNQRMFYRGRVVMITTQPQEVPDNFRLLPGMACTAEIKIGTRRVIEYFLYPLFRYLDGAIREP